MSMAESQYSDCTSEFITSTSYGELLGDDTHQSIDKNYKEIKDETTLPNRPISPIVYVDSRSNRITNPIVSINNDFDGEERLIQTCPTCRGTGTIPQGIRVDIQTCA